MHMNQFVTSEGAVRFAFLSGNYDQVYQACAQKAWQVLDSESDEPIFFLWSSFHHKGEIEIQKWISLFEQIPGYAIHVNLQCHIQLWNASRTARKQGDYDALIELERRFESIEDPLLLAILFSELSQCYFNDFDYKSAIVSMSRSLYFAKECHWDHYVLLQTIDLARLHFMQLNLDMCLHYLHEFMQYLKRPNLYQGDRYFMQASAMFMQIHYALNELEHCEVFCQNWLNLIAKAKLNQWLFGLLPLLEMMLNLSKTEILKGILTQIESQLFQRQSFDLLNITQYVITCRIKIHQAIQRQDAMELNHLYRSLIQNSAYYQKRKDLTYFYHSQLFLLAFYLKKFEDAARYLEQLIQQVGVQENSMMYLIYLNHHAILQMESGHPEQALEILCSLLYKIQDCGYLRLFSDYYLGTVQTLQKAVEICEQTNPLKPIFIQQLEAIFKFSLNSNLKSALLSERELEILHMLAQSFSNQEIAEKLYISVNTVKFHIKNIYQKLDVSNRQKAVKKATDLKLLSLT